MKKRISEILSKQKNNNNIFLNLFAFSSLFAVVLYIYLITFIKIPAENKEYANTALGFLAGTLLSTIVNFYFGSSKSSKDKDAVMARLTDDSEPEVPEVIKGIPPADEAVNEEINNPEDTK